MIDNPSWQHFATHDESEYPELWEGVRLYLAPCLGPTGTRLADLSGPSNWGTLTNMDAATDWVIDGGRYALDFDGFDDRVSIGSLTVTPSITCAGWVKRNGAPLGFNAPIITQGTLQGDSTSTFALYWNASLGWTFFALSATNTLAIVRSNTASSVGAWYHVAGVCSDREIVLYIDGKRVNSASGVAIKSSTQSANLGYGFTNSDQIHNGLLDDIIVRNGIMTDAEIAQLYQIGRGGMLTPRRRRRAYFVQTFSPGWASGSNVVLQPSIGVS